MTTLEHRRLEDALDADDAAVEPSPHALLIKQQIYIYIYIHIHTYIYIYMYCITSIVYNTNLSSDNNNNNNNSKSVVYNDHTSGTRPGCAPFYGRSFSGVQCKCHCVRVRLKCSAVIYSMAPPVPPTRGDGVGVSIMAAHYAEILDVGGFDSRRTRLN